MHTACFTSRAARLGVLALALTLCNLSTVVRAQQTELTPPAPVPEAATQPAVVPTVSDFMGEPAGYRELIAEALGEYQQKHFEEARALFRRAHMLFPNARTMRGQGMAEYELRNYGSAIACFESALGSNVRPLDTALRAETEQLLERARRFVARVRLELQPGTATVFVDGVLMEIAPGATLLLSVGNHTIEVRADAYRSTQRIVSVQGGEEQVLSVVLAPEHLTPTPPAPKRAGNRRFAGGVQASALFAVEGYARHTPGAGFDLNFWAEQSSWVLDARLGVRSDVTEPLRDYFQVPLELAAYRLLPIRNQGLIFGVGTGVTYLDERVTLTQTVGDFAVTVVQTHIHDRTFGVPVLARVGALWFRSSTTSVLTTVDYSVTFAKLEESRTEQALRFQVGLLFGRSRR